MTVIPAVRTRRRSLLGSLTVGAATIAAVVVVAPGPGGASAAGTAAFCSVGASYPGTTITWTGAGNGRSWNDAGNWSPKVVPDRHQRPATYQPQYVCIGAGPHGHPATVTIRSTDAYHVAGLDLGHGADLTIAAGGELFLGAEAGHTAVASTIEHRSELDVDAGTVGGNGPLTVAGTLRLTAAKVHGHKLVTTLTSSECAFDPRLAACPGGTVRGGGLTSITHAGRLLIDGASFGGVNLTDGRDLISSGTIAFRHDGYLAMSDGSVLTDQVHSSLLFAGVGGVVRGSATHLGPAPTIDQNGRLVRDGSGTNVVVVGVPVVLGKPSPAIVIRGGFIVLDRSTVPKAPVGRGGGYGLGSCELIGLADCKRPFATAAVPQTALVRASKEAGSPTVSTISVGLAPAPTTVRGHRTLGQAVNVFAPNKKTSHATHFTFSYDRTTKGLTAGVSPVVYRGRHAITQCAVHGLTARNTSCVLSTAVGHRGPGTKGDLTIDIITVQPRARWIVAR